jgi:hypothetical protein
VAESITLSFAIFPLMDILWEHSASLDVRAIFSSLGGMIFLSACASVLVWPDAPYEVIEERDALNCTIEVPREAALEQDLILSLRGVDFSTLDAVLSERSSAMPNNNKKDELLDGSFLKQLSSGVYIRLSLFFVVTTWWGNFYIATVTTELGDQQLFPVAVQHELARLLSFIDAAAIVCAPFSGYMLDSVGFVPTAFFAIAMGVVQNVCLLVAGSNKNIMIASFVAYSIFRAFLFPYYFASLSKKLGFRYFGMLCGVSFSTSGLAQFAIAPLATMWEGTCHNFDGNRTTNCDRGNWEQVHVLMLMVLVALVTIPVFDACASNREKNRTAKLLDTSTQSYGSVSATS